MQRYVPIVIILILLAALAIIGAWYVSTNPETVDQLLVDLELKQPQAEGISGSGFIEAVQVDIASELGGKTATIRVNEGGAVRIGDVLVELDTDTLDAQIRQAEAAIEAAEAQLARVKAGARLEQIQQAEAAVAQAIAARDGAKQAWEDAVAVRENPQQLDLQIDAAETELAVAQEGLRQAQASYDKVVVGPQAEDVAAAEAALRAAQGNLSSSQGALASAQANLARLLAGARERELEITRLGIDQAKDNLWGAQARRDAAKGNPYALPGDKDTAEAAVLQAEDAVRIAELQYEEMKAGARGEDVAAARALVKQAEGQVDAAQAQVDQAQAQLDKLNNSPTAEDLANAEAALAQARAQHAGAQQALQSLRNMRENPLEILAQVHTAEAVYHQAEAAVEAAQAQLALLKAGPTPEEMAAAEANVKQAEAALDALRVQSEKMTIRAPLDGLVVNRSIEPGEIASPGATLLRLANLDQVKLTIFVAETQIARVQLGQSVDVAVDAFPGRTFKGKVAFIAHEAEFTPRNVQTQEQRVNLVFAVKVSLDNPDYLLKPGMPADATIVTD